MRKQIRLNFPFLFIRRNWNSLIFQNTPKKLLDVSEQILKNSREYYNDN